MITRSAKATVILGLLCSISVQAQQPTPTRTAWHFSKVFNYTNDNLVGLPDASGIAIATVPNGFTGVIEQISARCVAPSTLSIIYGEIVVAANPADPGQSGKAAPAGQEDAANHPLLFQTGYSGSPKVYVASQAVKLRVTPAGRLTFILDTIKNASEPQAMTCLLSFSGYIEKQ